MSSWTTATKNEMEMSWEDLKAKSSENPVGKALDQDLDLRSKGIRSPHVHSKIRLFNNDSDTNSKQQQPTYTTLSGSRWLVSVSQNKCGITILYYYNALVMHAFCDILAHSHSCFFTHSLGHSLHSIRYCQKTMLLIEAKEIPIKIELVNMRSYGDKPMEFLSKVPNGMLPALEDNRSGNVALDSAYIMEFLEQAHPSPEFKRRCRTNKTSVVPICGISSS